MNNDDMSNNKTTNSGANGSNIETNNTNGLSIEESVRESSLNNSNNSNYGYYESTGRPKQYPSGNTVSNANPMYNSNGSYNSNSSSSTKYKNKKTSDPFSTILIIFGILFFGMPIAATFSDGIEQFVNTYNSSKTFRIIASTSYKFMESDLEKVAEENKTNLDIVYYSDLDIVEEINNSPTAYDAVWMSNSIWLYMLDNSSMVTSSKSTGINPVVMAVKKSKAQELGLVGTDITNKDILDLVRDKKLNYVMSNVNRTNTGATAYLGFVNSLAGSPEVLTSDMLQDNNLINDLRTFFTGVERTSGNEEYLEMMFKNGEYDAMINNESTLIELNKELVKEGKEPLYLLYPVDGVALNDMPFAYINNGQNKEEKFEVFQQYLRSDKVTKTLEKNGVRTWFGGVKSDADSESFKIEWGINTNKYLIPLKYPSKKVISEALDIYIEQLRKPSHTVFCLDVSGSMYGNGLTDLQDAMFYILDRESARKDRLQFSPYDKITILAFNSGIQSTTQTFTGDNTSELINYVYSLKANGGTNIYSPSVEALKILNGTSDDYTKTVILMTDGASNSGSFDNLRSYYEMNKLNIPIYGIMFGQSDEYQMNQIADLTNSKLFNGKEGLKEAFKEVRSYS